MVGSCLLTAKILERPSGFMFVCSKIGSEKKRIFIFFFFGQTMTFRTAGPLCRTLGQFLKLSPMEKSVAEKAVEAC